MAQTPAAAAHLRNNTEMINVLAGMYEANLKWFTDYHARITANGKSIDVYPMSQKINFTIGKYHCKPIANLETTLENWLKQTSKL